MLVKSTVNAGIYPVKCFSFNDLKVRFDLGIFTCLYNFLSAKSCGMSDTLDFWVF